MAYCTTADVQRYVPSVKDDDLDALLVYIADAETTVNAVLRESYDVPFTGAIDPFLTNVTARLAAGRYLQAKARSAEGSPAGVKLVGEARADLKAIVSDSSMLTTDVKTPTADETGGILTEVDEPFFDTGPASGWGT